MIDSSIIIACTLVYLSVLFFIAYYGDCQQASAKKSFQPIIYTLSITVYCTSWTFYGAVGSAAHSGWSFFTIYLGPILVFVFGFPFIKKIIQIAKHSNTTSIADFIATRYGKSTRIAALVTIIAFFGTLPYIALQIKAIANSYDTLNGVQNTSSSLFTDTGFVLAVILAVFSILFGARTIDASQHHKGLLYAISFESIVKLATFVAVAYLAYDIIASIASSPQQIETTFQLITQPFSEFSLTTDLITKTLLAAGAIFLLPRQFHVVAVEAQGGESLSRWGLPVYLMVFSIAVLPVTAAGLLLVEDHNNADLFVLILPMLEQHNVLSIFAYLGGLSAATGMVIVATLALSTMVSNDLIFPLLVRYYQKTATHSFHSILLFVRRTTIFALLLIAYGFYKIGGTDHSLQSIGLISFAAAIQFLPAVVAAVYWREAHRNGVFIGLLLGFLIWIYSLLLPSLAQSGWLPDAFSELLANKDSLINPQQLLGIQFDDALTHGVFWSLLVNLGCLVFFSLRATPSLTDQLQANSYVDQTPSTNKQDTPSPYKVTDLFELCIRFTGERRSVEYFNEHGYDIKHNLHKIADHEFIELSERLLATSIGSATAQHLIRTAQVPGSTSSQHLFEFIDKTGEAINFNRELLQTTLDHIGQAVSVVDKDLRLIAWNRQYLEFFSYPEKFIKVGKPIEEIISFNIERGYGPKVDPDEIKAAIQNRLHYLRQGERYTVVREWQDKQYIQIEGAPMPDGGYITTYTNISPLKKAEKRLASINETLEAKVEERTNMLSQVNQQLEEVLNTKTHFLAAASHDLLQPLAASKLYLGALQEDVFDNETQYDLAHNALSAIKTAESLLRSLLQLTKLDSGLVQPDVKDIELQSIFAEIENEFHVKAEQKGIRFKVIASGFVVHSDRHLLLSILQNLVSNAIRYTNTGSVVLLSRIHKDNQVRVEVRDTGKGFNSEQLPTMFQAFQQLDEQTKEGVGLGLTIVRKAINLLNHELEISSEPKQGSCFKVVLPRVSQQQTHQKKHVATQALDSIEGLSVACIDDSLEILNASDSLLSRWGIHVSCYHSGKDFLHRAEAGERFDVVIMDYQLEGKKSGLELLERYRELSIASFHGVLMTAEQDPKIKQQALDAGFKFLAKPTEPAKLRSLLQSFIS